jgi:hypothetical protein
VNIPRSIAIWIVSPPGYPHSRCFAEVALALRSALKSLGADAPIVTEPPLQFERTIVLGANLLPHLGAIALPPRVIIYNLEQILDGSPWLQPAYIDLLRRHAVWDYSNRNIAALKELGIDHAVHCGLGYAQELSCIGREAEDIDVLFVGSMNERRKNVINRLSAAGLKVAALFGVYGRTRDSYIARARVCLNVHFYESRVFEIVRVSYLLANERCVVSESGNDPELEDPFDGGIAFASYDRLAETCAALIPDTRKRESLARKGFEIFRNMPQAEMLRRAILATPELQ